MLSGAVCKEDCCKLKRKWLRSRRCRCWDNVKWIFKKWNVCLWTGLKWIWMLYSGRPLWSGNETLDFMQGIEHSWQSYLLSISHIVCSTIYLFCASYKNINLEFLKLTVDRELFCDFLKDHFKCIWGMFIPLWAKLYKVNVKFFSFILKLNIISTCILITWMLSVEQSSLN